MKLAARIAMGVLAVVAVAAVGFGVLYTSRIQTANSIEKLTDYDDYNLYRMQVRYDYDLDKMIANTTVDNQSFIDAAVKQALPLLRYRTHDITRLIKEPCKCGRTTIRMQKIAGRSDDMLIIRGVNVFPSQIESALIGMEGIGPHYEIVVTKKGFMDQIEVKVELTDASLLEAYGELEALTKKIHDKLKVVLQIDAKVTLVSPNTLKRFEGKAKRVIDNRTLR